MGIRQDGRQLNRGRLDQGNFQGTYRGIGEVRCRPSVQTVETHNGDGGAHRSDAPYSGCSTTSRSDDYPRCRPSRQIKCSAVSTAHQGRQKRHTLFSRLKTSTLRGNAACTILPEPKVWKRSSMSTPIRLLLRTKRRNYSKHRKPSQWTSL